jgi:hypothetical protein
MTRKTAIDPDLLEKLEFILNKGEEENASDKDKMRAVAIRVNIHVFYEDAIRFKFYG